MTLGEAIAPLLPLRAVGFAVLTLLASLPAAFAHAITFAFTKIADRTTSVPDGSGSVFSGFGNPSIEGDYVAFSASTFRPADGTSGRGVYKYRSGMLTRVADWNTPVPEGPSNFSWAFGDPSLSNGHVAFLGGSAIGLGIYTDMTGALSRAVDTSTPIPGRSANFARFEQASLDANRIAFRGWNSSESDQGIYIWDSVGTLTRVADLNTPIPGGGGTFTNFQNPQLSGVSVLFPGWGAPSQAGIYISRSGTLARVVDTNTPVPGTSGTFVGVPEGRLSGNGIAFIGIPETYIQGIYTAVSGTLTRIVDRNTPLPNGSGTFSDGFGEFSFSNGHLAFRGSAPNRRGIYTDLTGSVTTVIENGMLLEGKTVSELDFSREGFDVVSLAFSVRFTDGSAAIYRADPVYALTVSLGGAGRVTSNVGAIDCGMSCSDGYAARTRVTLTAMPNADLVIHAWSGCDSASGATCTVAIDGPRTVTVDFAPRSASGPTAFAVDLVCPIEASRSAVLDLSVIVSNSTAIPRTVTRGALMVHAGQSRAGGPSAVPIMPIVVGAGNLGEPTRVRIPLRVALRSAAPRTMMTVGVGLLGQVATSQKRQLLGTAACIIEIK